MALTAGRSHVARSNQILLKKKKTAERGNAPFLDGSQESLYPGGIFGLLDGM